jgi:DNA-binding response OmpR family regulator
MVNPQQPGSAAAAPRVRMRVLLVDDQRFVGLALARLLDHDTGVELHCCERASEAVATAVRVRPDLILQDLVMPDIDGLTLVRSFRQQPSTAATPIVVLSGNDDEATRTHALAAGAVDYLVKLPSKDVLLACLARHLAGTSAVDTVESTAVDHGSGELLDLSVLESFREAGAVDPDEAVRTLVEIFQIDSARLTGDLRAALAAGEHAVLSRSAHALKGCAMAIGAHRLAAMCAALETGDSADAASLTRLEHEIEQVNAACTRAVSPAETVAREERVAAR